MAGSNLTRYPALRIEVRRLVRRMILQNKT